MADLHPTERLYRKIVKPSLGILNIDSHTSRHRIRLHSSFQPRMQGQLYTLKNRPRTEPTDSLVQTFPRLTDALVGSPEFSSNFVYSYNSQVQDDLANLNRSSTPQSFNSTTKVKQLPLPSVSPTGRTVSSVSPSRGIKSVSICSDRYLGTHSKLSREGKSEGVSSLKARSEQQRRFEIESRAKLKSRALKRTSEIIPHRVDRTYYMSGASVPLKNKYLVDNEELERLKELSRSRSSRSLRARVRTIHKHTNKQDVGLKVKKGPSIVQLELTTNKLDSEKDKSVEEETEPAVVRGHLMKGRAFPERSREEKQKIAVRLSIYMNDMELQGISCKIKTKEFEKAQDSQDNSKVDVLSEKENVNATDAVNVDQNRPDEKTSGKETAPEE